MKVTVVLLGVFLAAVAAVPSNQLRIAGGSVTTIKQYPSTVSMLHSQNGVAYNQECGGAIITTKRILSAANCYDGHPANKWRVRVGSTYANNGGKIHNVAQIVFHPSFNSITMDSDIAIIHLSTPITYGTGVQQGSIAGVAYNLPDNAPVYAVGWGNINPNGPASEQLRHVQIWAINQNTCRSRYSELGLTITDNMLCSGWLDVGGRGQCVGDSGSPLFHNNVIVGVYSWGQSCALARYPGVNARVSRFTTWIQSNASA